MAIRKIKNVPAVEFDFEIPKEVRAVAGLLGMNGFAAYLVGGCLRDLLLKRVPKDWDIATSAKPEEIQKLFSSFAEATEDKPATIYENEFGTVGIKTRSEDPTLAVVEVTTFRKDGKYSDSRHPDKITFAKTIEEDLGRRDFTCNAIAAELITNNSLPITGNSDSHKSSVISHQLGLVDPFNGLRDIEAKMIRAVGEPEKRFEEDALRLMRAVRFETQLGISNGWRIEETTGEAIRKLAGKLSLIAHERVRDEFEKIIMSRDASDGIRRLDDIGLLQHIIPELREGIDCGQNKHHIYTVFEHNVRALEHAAKEGYSLDVRLASLLHDVGKPKTKRGEGVNSTFYGHQVVGERMSREILSRLHFPKAVIDRVALLVREHMFMYDPDVVSIAGVRRLVKRVGAENMDALLEVREGDRIGSGVPKARPYRIRHLEAMIEKAKTDPISPKMLAVNGTDLMKELKVTPGPRLGKMIAILLEDVLEDTGMNDRKKLIMKAQKLNEMSDRELDALGKKAREAAEGAQERVDEGIKKKYFVS